MPFTVPGSGLAMSRRHAVKTGLMAVPASMLANCASDQKPSAAVAPAPVASVPASGMRTYLFRSGQNFAEVYAKVDPERMMRDVPPKYDAIVYRQPGPLPRVFERRVLERGSDYTGYEVRGYRVDNPAREEYYESL